MPVRGLEKAGMRVRAKQLKDLTEAGGERDNLFGVPVPRFKLPGMPNLEMSKLMRGGRGGEAQISTARRARSRRTRLRQAQVSEMRRLRHEVWLKLQLYT